MISNSGIFRFVTLVGHASIIKTEIYTSVANRQVKEHAREHAAGVILFGRGQNFFFYLVIDCLVNF